MIGLGFWFSWVVDTSSDVECQENVELVLLLYIVPGNRLAL